MTALQEQVVQRINGLSEDNLQFLLELIDRFMPSEAAEKKETRSLKRIGIVKGRDLYEDNYDFDELNPEIAKMFGAEE